MILTKRIIAIVLATLLSLCAVSCGAKPKDILSEKDNSHGATLDDTKPNLDVSGDASPFDHMTTAAFRREVKPYLEAWYEFCYRGMWWFSLNISEGRELVETEDAIYVRAADYNTKTSLSDYIATWLARDTFSDILDVQTYEDQTGLYLLQISTGWYGEPDYNDCKLVSVKDGKYYVSFNEKSGLYQEETITHVVIFEKIGGKLLITGSLTVADGLEMVVESVLASEITPDVMTAAEFKEFVTLMLNRYCQFIGYVNFSESSISRCTEEWINAEEGVDCAAEVIVNGKNCYVLIGVDINGRYDVIRIQEI